MKIPGCDYVYRCRSYTLKCFGEICEMTIFEIKNFVCLINCLRYKPFAF